MKRQIKTESIYTNSLFIKGRPGLSLKEIFLTIVIFFCSMTSFWLFAGIAFFLIKNGLAGFSILTENYGIREYFVNTLLLLLITLPLAGVIGVLGGVYLCEYAKDGKIIQSINLAISILSGVPSIVFGLFGMVFFGEMLHLGYSLLTGALTLTFMVLPVIIENTKEIIKTIPKEYRMGALGLGAEKWQMIGTILLPGAMPGIAAGLTLSAGKILGESAALLFTAGSKGSLAVALYMMIGKGKFKEGCSIALILLFIMVFLNLLIQYIREHAYKDSKMK